MALTIFSLHESLLDVFYSDRAKGTTVPFTEYSAVQITDSVYLDCFKSKLDYQFNVIIIIIAIIS